ncbi:CocE/NonD family hydrolase [Stenotrophobium rhamnosiphilum]|uniref:Peptidase S15 n=1 Tax=Stenotrophobium rhamnosiphilum TaxID=2029166 RepID=A0A2T5MFD9_9GAMM|nr:CocE/NonD family hydrolase [Stenotrophobium rhamnosiphilum]PTU31303.1 peptidase S15 [Stenotrophobium rhamnosiphilum]
MERSIKAMRHIGVAAIVAAIVFSAGCSRSSSPDGSSSEGSGSNGWTTNGTRGTLAKKNVPIKATSDWVDYNPEATYPKSVTSTDTITMADGTKLAATIVLPADASGKAVDHPVPTVLTITGYNKAAGTYVPAIGGANTYLVSHGYAHVIVDERGTGASDGQWEAFGATEQGDYKPTIRWVATQPFCNGNIGLYGASLLAITAVLSAAQQDPAVKAMFPIVPMGDAYRDIVFNGGQVNVGFIPLWLGLVTALGVLDPNIVLDPATGLQQELDRVLSAVTNFQVPTILNAVVGDPDTAFDGDFWASRSPIEQAGKIQIPTFIVGGLQDIFQRGEPMLYEALKNHTPTKLLIGPWTHVDAAMGANLPLDGVPVLDHITLQWFDQYVKGMNVGANKLPNVTQYVYGEGHYVTASDWPHPQAKAQRLFLRGDKSLSLTAPTADEATNFALQQPVSGICSASTSQWTAGLLGLLPLSCFKDNTLAEALDVHYETPAMTEDYYFNGPIAADIWIATTGTDAGLSVRVDDVFGSTVTPISNGLLTASMRAVDETRSRKLDGQRIQPWHPFTQEAVLPVTSGTPVLMPVEIFPTSAMIKAGHKLRISVGASDFPHGLPPLPNLVNGLIGGLTIYSDAAHPSSVVLPVVPVTALK